MKILIMLVSGLGAVLLGLPYIFHAFGPAEAEVAIWGQVSLYMGISLMLLSIAIGRSTTRVARILLSLGFSSLALLQVFPILLWSAFHGAGISDGTPPSEFMAHWLYAIPHLLLLIASLLVLYQLRRFPTLSTAY